ncbi:MAG: hypothetical protein ACOX9R_11985 [Armatimonadota bacterium]|jgi:hypothetical protein
MQMIFSFDTEDYVDPLSNDALLRLAQIHTKHDVPAVFGLVGEKARFIHFCGRDDVVEALKDHEVAYHSDHHWILPNPRYEPEHIPAFVNGRDWDTGIDRILAEESRGLADIGDVFGERPITQLRNYGDWTPQVMAAHARLGLGVHAYGPVFHNRQPEPIWYCNQLQIANPRHMYEDYLHDENLTPREKLDRHIADVQRHLDEGTFRLGWVNHPTRFIADTWWEQPNWWGDCDDPPRRDWSYPPRFDAETIEQLLWIADELVGWVARQPEIEIRTFREFYAEHRPTRVWVTQEEVRALAEAVGDRPAMVMAGGESFSPAELLGVFAHALGAREGGRADQLHPLRRILGPTEQPAETAQGSASGATLREACFEAELFIRDHGRVPARVAVGDAEVGPGALLVAMARMIRGDTTEQVQIPAADNLPEEYAPGHYEAIETQGFPLGYIQYQGRREELDFSAIRRHAKWQYWTFKVATKTA